MAMNIEAARMLTWKSAYEIDQVSGAPARPPARPPNCLPAAPVRAWSYRQRPRYSAQARTYSLLERPAVKREARRRRRHQRRYSTRSAGSLFSV
jgi:hypothetical protein